MPKKSRIGVKIGHNSGRWIELDRDAAQRFTLALRNPDDVKMFANLLTDAIAKLDLATWKPNDLGGYKPKSGRTN